MCHFSARASRSVHLVQDQPESDRLSNAMWCVLRAGPPDRQLLLVVSRNRRSCIPDEGRQTSPLCLAVETHDPPVHWVGRTCKTTCRKTYWQTHHTNLLLDNYAMLCYANYAFAYWLVSTYDVLLLLLCSWVSSPLGLTVKMRQTGTMTCL